MTTVSMFLPSMSGTSGNTLWLFKSSDYSLVNASGDALTESGTSGWFTADVAEAWTETLAATVLDTNSLASGYGWLAVGETQVKDTQPAVLDSAALAKFVTVDTGETVAAAGSVAKLAQGSTGEAALSQEGLNSIIAGVQSVHVGITEAVESSALTIVRGDTWVQSITGLGTLTGKKVTFALKTNARDTDANAVIFIDEDTGLTTIKGVTAPDSSLGSITIDDASAGDITIRLESSVTLQLATGQYHDALKAIKDNADFTLRNNGVTTVILGVIQEVS